MTVILYEGFTTFRQIFTDGRALPKDPQPSWLGYSVGKWEGDTFVVDTIGINDKTWMDNAGRPHSDALHTTERYRRRDFGTMDVTLTIDDPKAYTRPWTVNASPSRLVVGQDLLEVRLHGEQQGRRASGRRQVERPLQDCGAAA